MSDLVEKVKVIFNKVFVLKNPDFGSDGDFKFTARVDGQPVGDPKHVFEGGEGDVIVLPQPLWSKVVNVASKSEFRISFHGIDEDGFLNGDDDDVGTVERTVKRPFKQELDRHSATAFFLLEYNIEVELEGKFGRHLPGEVVAARETPTGLECTTIATAKFVARAEAHSVVPVPKGAPDEPIRPPLPAGVTDNADNEATPAVSAASPINILPNPAVIPILTLAQQALPIADQLNIAARIELTRYRPASLNFAPDDARLKWTVRPIGGGQIDFLTKPQGTKIVVAGKTAGEVVLECRLAREVLAVYRALVAPLKVVFCRFNIIDGKPRTGPIESPASSPADILNHLKIANLFLRQMALELVPDAISTIQNKLGHTVTATGTTGIFRVVAPIGFTKRMSLNAADTITKVNFRNNVMNFCYVISDQDGALGAATHYANHPLQTAKGVRPSVSETSAHSPTASWVKPCGVAPDGAAGTVTLRMIEGRLPAAGLFAMYICNRTAAPGSAAGQRSYASTMAHEFGHVLTLGHRIEGTNKTHPTPGVPAPPGTPPGQLVANGIFFDGLNHPPLENVMRFRNVPERNDFDTLQATAARSSQIVAAS